MLCNLDLFRAAPMLIHSNLRDGYHLTPLQFIPVSPRVAPEQEPASAQRAAGSATHHESRKGGAGAGEIRSTTDIVCAEASPINSKTEINSVRHGERSA